MANDSYISKLKDKIYESYMEKNIKEDTCMFRIHMEMKKKICLLVSKNIMFLNNRFLNT